MRARVLPVASHPCQYLVNRSAKTEHAIAESVDTEALDSLLSAGYRHFGSYFFRPACDGCTRCVPLRIVLAGHSPGRSARRVLRANSDLRVEIHRADPTQESYQLYLSHKRRFKSATGESFESYTQSFYFEYAARRTISCRLDHRLVARIHLDLTRDSCSAIYCYYDDTESRRSLGTFSILKAVELARASGARYLYLGYFIDENRSMRYKSRFYPNELLDRGQWTEAVDREGHLSARARQSLEGDDRPWPRRAAPHREVG